MKLTSWIILKLEMIGGFMTAASSGVVVATQNPHLDLEIVVLKTLLAAIISGTIGTLSGWLIKITLIRYLKKKLKIDD